MKSAKERLIEIKKKLDQYHSNKIQAQSPPQTPDSDIRTFKPVIGNTVKIPGKIEDTVSDKSDIILLETDDKIVVTNRAQLLREAVSAAESWKKKHSRPIVKNDTSKSCSHVFEILKEELTKHNERYKECDVSRYDFDEYISADSLVPCNSMVRYLGMDCRFRPRCTKSWSDNS